MIVELMVTFFYVTTKQLEPKAIIKNCLVQKMDIITLFFNHTLMPIMLINNNLL
jgi:hypothetical protein